MKIAMVIPKLILAGAETMCENLATSLAKQGHDVTVVALFDGTCPINRRLEANGVKVITLGKRMGFDPLIKSRLRTTLIDIQPDVVHTHLYVTKYALPATDCLICRRIHTMHNVAAEENKTRFGVFLNKLYFSKYSVRLIALSEKIQETVCEMYHKRPDQVPIINNGIPLERCIPKTEHKKGDELEILNIGRLTEQKNQLMLVDAMVGVHKKHRGARLTIIGDGELKDALRARIKEHSAQDYIKILLPTDKVYEKLHDADIFALPSIYEGMPMTLLEAMGTGIPILAGNVGGIPDMLTDGENALLCEPTVADIEAKLNNLLEDDELREKLAKKALADSENFSADAMAAKYLDQYRTKNSY